jgi:hypothetical protein
MEPLSLLHSKRTEGGLISYFFTNEKVQSFVKTRIGHGIWGDFQCPMPNAQSPVPTPNRLNQLL